MEMLGTIVTATDIVNKKYVDDRIPTLASLMGSSAIGSTSAYPYWTGTAWATKSLGSFAFKSSLAFSELTSKPTTLAGYGITDAYTAGAMDTKLSGYLPLTGGILTGALTVGEGADLGLKASAATPEDPGDLVFRNYSNTEVGRIWLDPNKGAFMLRYGSSDAAKTLIHSGNIESYNAGSATRLATARTIWGQSFDGSGNVSGALSGATTISASSVVCGTESIRVNAADNAANFGYMRVETVSSNRGLVHFGGNYGGSTNIANTSVRVDAIGLYRGVVGIGRTYTYDELFANHAAGVSLHVNQNLKVGASAIVTTSLEVPYMICGGQSTGCYFGAASDGIGSSVGGGLIYTYGSSPLWFYVGGSSAMSIGSDRGLTMESYAHIKGGLCVGTTYTADGTAGAPAVVLRSEGGIEISHASTPYIDFHYANSTSDYSVRLINKAANTLNLYGSFCGGTNETYSLGTSSIRWHTLYTSYIDAVGTSTLAKANINTAGITAATINTATVTTLKIGSATLVYDSAAGALKIDGNVFATGQMAAGGAAAEGTASAGGPVNVNVSALFRDASGIPQSTLDAAGLTVEVIENLLHGVYTKVVYVTDTGIRDCWSYDGYGHPDGGISLYFRQGDGFSIENGLELMYHASGTNAGTWTSTTGEI